MYVYKTNFTQKKKLRKEKEYFTLMFVYKTNLNFLQQRLYQTDNNNVHLCLALFLVWAWSASHYCYPIRLVFSSIHFTSWESYSASNPNTTRSQYPSLLSQVPPFTPGWKEEHRNKVFPKETSSIDWKHESTTSCITECKLGTLIVLLQQCQHTHIHTFSP